jgi:hypothetical protein
MKGLRIGDRVRTRGQLEILAPPTCFLSPAVLGL